MKTLRKLSQARKSEEVEGKKVLNQNQMNFLEEHFCPVGSVSGTNWKVGRREIQAKERRETLEVNALNVKI